MKNLEEMLRELSEKYKNSKSVEVYEEDLEWWFKIIDDLREENKNLNIKVASLEWEIKWLNSVIDKLKEENQTLELWLDRKEKLNEKYRKEIAEQETEWHWLFDEIDYRKRECKKLKDRIDVLYEFIERNDKLVDEVIDEEDLDKLNRYICIDDDLVDRTLESED